MPTPITKTISNDGTKDYTSFATWESTEQKDLVAADENHILECYKGTAELNSAVFIDGWTTDATRNIKLTVPSTDRHSGVYTSTFADNGFVAFSSATGRNNFDVDDPNVEFDGLTIYNSQNRQSIETDWGASDEGYIHVHHCIFFRSNIAIFLVDQGVEANSEVKIWNNIFYTRSTGTLNSGIRYNVDTPSWIYGNTIFDLNQRGIWVTSTSSVVAKMNLVVDCGLQDFYPAHTDFAAGSDYNGSSAGSGDSDRAPGANSIYSVSAASTFVNITNNTEDLHLVSTSATAYNAGTDLTGDANIALDDDIDYEVRTSSKNDIGADDHKPTLTFTMDMYVWIDCTEDVKSVGTDGGSRDYTSLSTWESTEQADLVAANKCAVAECYNDAEMTGPVTMSGWTTDRWRRIIIRAATGEQHDGTKGTGFRFRNTAVINDNINVQQENVTIDGIAFSAVRDGRYGVGISPFSSAEGMQEVRNCLFYDDGVGAINAFSTGNTEIIWIYSNFMIGANAANRMQIGMNVSHVDPTYYVFNNSIHGGSSHGILVGASSFNVIAKNNAVFDCTNNFNAKANFHADSDYNASNSLTSDADGPPGSNSIGNLTDSDNFTNVTLGSQDLHIVDETADIFRAGVNVADNGNPFDIPNVLVDIDRENITADPPDIGADFFVTGITTTFTMDMYMSGDVSKVTLGLSGRSFSSIISWESSRQDDLTSPSKVEFCECYDDGEILEHVTIDGWTTSPFEFIRIYTPLSERHFGDKFNGFTLRWSFGFDDQTVMIINEPNVWVEGIIMSERKDSGLDPFGRCLVVSTPFAPTGWIRIEACVFHAYDVPINVSTLPTLGLHISSCAVYPDFAVTEFPQATAYSLSSAASNDIYIYNCSTALFGSGITGNASINVRAKNCVALGGGFEFDKQLSRVFHADSDYNASSSGVTVGHEAPGGNSLTGLTDANQFVQIVVGLSGDWAIKDENADILQAGDDLSADEFGWYPFDVRGIRWNDSTTYTSADMGAYRALFSDTFTADAYLARKLDFTADALLARKFEWTTDMLVSPRFEFTTDIYLVDKLDWTLDLYIAQLDSFTLDTYILVRATLDTTIDLSLEAERVSSSIGTGGGRDYSTMASWESGEQRDLTTPTPEIEQGDCYNDSEFADGIFIDGWTVSGWEFPHIRAAQDSEKMYGPDFTIDTRDPDLTPLGVTDDNPGFQPCITMNIPYVWVDGIRFLNNQVNFPNIRPNYNGFGSLTWVKVSNCVSHRSDGHGLFGIQDIDDGASIYIWNCMFSNRQDTAGGAGINLFGDYDGLKAYIVNVSGYRKANGIAIDSKIDIITSYYISNCAVLECGGNDYFFHDNASGQFPVDLGSHHNADADGTAPGTFSITTTAALAFKAASSSPSQLRKDLRLSGADSPLYRAGQQDAPESGIALFLDDGMGAARATNPGWSIGWHQGLNDWFTIDMYVVFKIDPDTLVEIYTLNNTDPDVLVEIYTRTQTDIDVLVEITRVVPSLTFLVRKPGVETLDYSQYVSRAREITRRLEFEQGVSQAVQTSVEASNEKGLFSKRATTGDFYPDIRNIWNFAGLKSGWGKGLDKDSRFVFVGRTESLDLSENRRGNFVLVDELRNVLEEEITAAITFDAARVAAQPNLDSLNPVHIVEHLLIDLLDIKTWDFDIDAEVQAIDTTSFSDSFNATSDIVVNDTTWPAESSIIEMIQGCLIIIGGWLYTGGDGKFRLKVFDPYTLPDTPKAFIGDESDSVNSTIFKARHNTTRRKMINRIKWKYGQSDIEHGPIDDTASQTLYGIIKKDFTTGWELSTEILDSASEHLLSRFATPVETMVYETENLNQGDGFNAELAEIVTVTDVSAGITARSYQIVQKTEDLLQRRSKLNAEDVSGLDGKFGMAPSEIDEGDGLGITADDTFATNWLLGFAFAGNADLTDPHYNAPDGGPGFDDDGNNNDVMDDDVAPFDARQKSIEQIFVAY